MQYKRVRLTKFKKEERDMRTREMLKTGMVGALMALFATPAFARTVELKEAGAALWIFVAIGAVIILLQLIPAAILFFSFIGTTVTMGLKKEKKVEEEVTVPGMEPVPVKK
jgi:membrane associated rhomboid family serine protease